MADNVVLDPGAGGDTVAADDVGGVKYQVVKIDVGADGVAAPLGNANPIPVSDAGGTLTVDGTVAVTNAGLTELAAAINASSQMDVNVAAALPAGNANIGDVDVASIAAGNNNIGDVDIASIAAGDNNIGNVDIVTMPTVTVNAHAVTNAGVFAVQVDGAALTALQLIDDPVAVLGTATYTEATTSGMIVGAVRRDADTTLVNTTNEIGPLQMDANGRLKVEAFSGETLPVSLASLPASTNTLEVVGDAADDAAVAGNPVLVAGSSIQTDTTDPTAVSAENEVATLRTDMQRNLLVNITHPRLFRVSADYASAQTNTSVQATPGASLSLYITDVIISNGAVAGNITLLDGSGGTVLLEIYPAINGGVAHSFRNPLRLTANTALVITSTTVTTHAVTVTGYIAP